MKTISNKTISRIASKGPPWIVHIDYNGPMRQSLTSNMIYSYTLCFVHSSELLVKRNYGTVDGPEFCSCLTLFHIESVGFLVSSPSKYTTWNLRCHIYISRNNYRTNVTEEPLLQLKAVHSFWCVNEDIVWFCVIVSVLWLLSVLVMLISKSGPLQCMNCLNYKRAVSVKVIPWLFLQVCVNYRPIRIVTESHQRVVSL